MNARLPALLLCGTLSAVVAGVVSLLMAESAEVPHFNPEVGPLEDAAQPLHDVLSRLDALSRAFEDQLAAVSRVPADGYATKAEVDTLRERIEAVAEAVGELRHFQRKASLVASLSKKVLSVHTLSPAQRERVLEYLGRPYGLNEMQMAQLRELEITWEMRDRNLLVMCDGASAIAVVQAIASHEAEYRAAFEAILTPDQREEQRKYYEKYGGAFISRRFPY